MRWSVVACLLAGCGGHPPADAANATSVEAPGTNPASQATSPIPDESTTASCLGYATEDELCAAFQEALPGLHGDAWDADQMEVTGTCDRVAKTDEFLALRTRVGIRNYGESYYVAALAVDGSWRPVAIRRSDNIDGNEDSCDWEFHYEGHAPFALVTSKVLCTMPASMEGAGSHGIDRVTVLRVDGAEVVRTGDAVTRFFTDDGGAATTLSVVDGRVVFGEWSDGQGGVRIAPDSCPLCGAACGFADVRVLGSAQGREGCVSDVDCFEGRCEDYFCTP